MVECSGETLDRVFSAVADPTRRAILAGLARKPATVTEIAAPFGVSLNAISKHILVLERAGLVERQVVGREHRCRLNPAPLRNASAWLEHYRKILGSPLGCPRTTHPIEAKKERTSTPWLT